METVNQRTGKKKAERGYARQGTQGSNILEFCRKQKIAEHLRRVFSPCTKTPSDLKCGYYFFTTLNYTPDFFPQCKTLSHHGCCIQTITMVIGYLKHNWKRHLLQKCKQHHCMLLSKITSDMYRQRFLSKAAQTVCVLLTRFPSGHSEGGRLFRVLGV